MPQKVALLLLFRVYGDAAVGYIALGINPFWSLSFLRARLSYGRFLPNWTGH
jgi:hypothetical protein